MHLFPGLTRAWQAFWRLRKQHEVPGWTRVLIACGLALLAWLVLFMLGLAGVLTVETRDPAFLSHLLTGVLILFQVVALTVVAVLRLAERLLPETVLDRLSPVRDWRSAAGFSLLLLAGVMLGNLAGSVLLSLLYPSSEAFSSSALGRQVRFLQLLPLLAVVNGLFWRQRLARHAIKAEAAEAQLRLLHAQIEPHFLFNTLATIESLLDADPARARAMLEAFSDHLRAGMTQLRSAETTLAAELDMAANYLRLLQIRMQTRLSFSIEAAPDARAALLPSLLLQPLVENAVRHGLEPKVEGGCVRIRARVAAGRLRIEVDDDGLGMDAAAARSQPGSGTALANIRMRLQHRFGERGTLRLAPPGAGSGTCAMIELPYRSST